MLGRARDIAARIAALPRLAAQGTKRAPRGTVLVARSAYETNDSVTAIANPRQLFLASSGAIQPASVPASPPDRMTRKEPAPMAKVVCVLYDDPVDGYPEVLRARRPARRSSSYPGGQTLPTPQGDRLHARRSCWAASRASSACARSWRGRPHAGRHLRQGRRRIQCSNSELPDADIVISQPFWPAYLTAERIAQGARS